MHQYYCRNCGYERKGLLDAPYGIGGYSWVCPACSNSNAASRLISAQTQEISKDS